MGFARHVSNHVIFLDQGKIEEQGDPKEVLIHPKSERLQQFLENIQYLVEKIKRLV